MKQIIFICIVMGAILSTVLVLDLQNAPMINNAERIEQPRFAPKYANQKKWIVVTSVNYPTEDIKRLASLDEWRVVVVGDTKTPKNWSYPAVEFLSVEDQKSLGLKLPRLLPFKSYTRKNVGYLYAIMNGAEWIYDTDDDNKPFGLGLNQFDYTHLVSGLRYTPNNRSNFGEKLFNPYRYFGYKDMWPRGFPLEFLSDHTNGEDRQILCKEMRTASVQQGIVHKDPDVDAIYRLLHADKVQGLNVTFNKFVPPILLESGTYAPWNSQNTLFHRRAFFTMFLPTSVAFRVTDIWRSYFSQKMLHLIGDAIAFYPVNAVQFRNAHNYLNDFQEEGDVYEKSGEIVQFIDTFNCSSNDTVLCFKELANGFRQEGFIKSEDVVLMDAWIDDLLAIGYEFPPISSENNMFVNESEYQSNCRRANLEIVADSVDETSQVSSRSTEKVTDFNDLLTWCYENLTDGIPSPSFVEDKQKSREGLLQKEDTALVLINNYPWTKSIGLLQRMYSPYFAITIFCGPWFSDRLSPDELNIKKPISFVHLTEEENYNGHRSYYCVSKIRDLRLQNIKGYFFVADDTVFNFWQVLPLDVVLISTPLREIMNGYWWNQFKIGRDAAAEVVKLMEGKYANDSNRQRIWQKYEEGIRENGYNESARDLMLNHNGRILADIYYIPSADFGFYADMCELIMESRLFVEIAHSKIAHGLKTQVFKNFVYLWQNRPLWHKYYNSTVIGVHPIKTSGTHDGRASRKGFCDKVVTTFKENLV